MSRAGKGRLLVLLLFTVCGGGCAPTPDGSSSQSRTAGTHWRPRDIALGVNRIASSATQDSAASRQGDSAAVTVVFAATGGTVSAGGLYTAGSSGGTFRVVATSGAVADTSTVTVTLPLASGAPPSTPLGSSGIPFGPFGLFTAPTSSPLVSAFTLGHDSYRAANILARIEGARERKIKLSLALTGGAHSNYLTDGKFDLARWKSKMDTYNTVAIRSAVAAAVADGTIIGNTVLDEPHHASWGGVMTKALIDQMCGYVKDIFPTLPAGVTHSHLVFETTKSYAVCDFMIDQYAQRKGEVAKFRDDGLAMGRRDGIAVLFSLNLLDGGEQLRGCPIPQTGGKGTFGRNCRMTAQQVQNYGMTLGPAGCALLMWRYDDDFMLHPENQQAFKEVSGRLATVPAKPCKRS